MGLGRAAPRTTSRAKAAQDGDRGLSAEDHLAGTMTLEGWGGGGGRSHGYFWAEVSSHWSNLSLVGHHQKPKDKGAWFSISYLLVLRAWIRVGNVKRGSGVPNRRHSAPLPFTQPVGSAEAHAVIERSNSIFSCPCWLPQDFPASVNFSLPMYFGEFSEEVSVSHKQVFFFFLEGCVGTLC